MLKTKKIRIAVLNFWSLDNIGDKLILEAFFELIKDLFSISNIYIFTYDPESFKKYVNKYSEKISIIPAFSKIIKDFLYKQSYLIKMKKLSTLISILSIFFYPLIMKLSFITKGNIRKMKENLEKSDLIFLIGGNYITAPKGKSAFPALEQLVSIFYVKFILKKVVIILPQSIGPLDYRSLRFLAKIILSKVDLIIVREHLSFIYLKTILGLSKNIIQKPDLAFLNMKKINNIKSNNPGKNILGVVLKGSHEFISNMNFIKEIARSLYHLSNMGYIIFLIPFSYIESIEDDRILCNLILNCFNTQNIMIYNINLSSLDEINKKLNFIDIIVTTRLHPAILGCIIGIPSIILASPYDYKYYISEYLGLDKYKIEVSSFSVDLLVRTIEKITHDRNKLVLNLSKVSRALLSDVCSIKKFLKLLFIFTLRYNS